MKDLSQYSIGVIRGYNYSEAFDTADYLNKEEVGNVVANIKKIESGRIDLFIDSRDVVLWTLKTDLPESINLLEVVEPQYSINKLYVPISKKNKNYVKIVEALNKGLKMLKEDGTFDKIKKLHGF